MVFVFSRDSVPALPVKNLTSSGPVHPALAGYSSSTYCTQLLSQSMAPRSIQFPPVVAVCFRYDRDPDVRCRSTRLLDSGAQTHSPPTGHQQEWPEACPRDQRHEAQNQEEAPEERWEGEAANQRHTLQPSLRPWSWTCNLVHYS